MAQESTYSPNSQSFTVVSNDLVALRTQAERSPVNGAIVAMLKRIRANLLFVLVIISNPLWAQPESPPPMKTIDVDIAAHQIPKRVEPPKTFEVMTLVVKLDASVEIGESDSGVRRYVPITGGYFQGKNISGTVLAGGADWQLQRRDDVLEIDALYSIRTEDGQNIIIHNTGLASRDAEAGEFPYIRTTPTFKAPIGQYDWLNKRVFTGTITPIKGANAVVIRVFQVD